MANKPPSDASSIRRAHEIAANSADGQIPAEIIAILEQAFARIWRELQSNPDVYVPTLEEFSVLNYYQDRFRDRPDAQSIYRRAVNRYWSSRQGSSANRR